MEFSEFGDKDVDPVNDLLLYDWDGDSVKTCKKSLSATKTHRAGLQWFGDYDFKTVAYQKEEEIASEFPPHIIKKEDKKIKEVVKEHVLPFLPAKSLMKFRTVSKEWDQWIASPFLAYQQSFLCKSFSGYFYQDVKMGSDPIFLGSKPKFLPLDHSTNGVPSPSLHFLPETVNVLSSCNGLLLCRSLSEKYYVCNPANKNWKELPLPLYYHGAEPAIVLAFDPSPRNIEGYYRVICAYPVIGQPFFGFEIYSSASDSWSCSSAYCTELEDTNLLSGGFYLKGVAYYETIVNEVLAFDVKAEIPAVISLPVLDGRHGSLTQLEGELCYVAAHNECGNVFLIDIYQGMDMSLKRSVSVNLGPERMLTQSCKVLPCVNNDAVAIHCGRFIYFYHLREQRVEVIKLPSAISGKNFLPYVNSLAMLPGFK